MLFPLPVQAQAKLDPGYHPPQKQCPITADVPELSGLAPSRTHPGHFWVNEDHSFGPILVLLGPDGKRRATLRIMGGENWDWEAMGAFETPEGTPYLVAGDVGDNLGARGKGGALSRLYFIQEPELPLGASARVFAETTATSMTFRFDDGPSNCEAMAVDMRDGKILLARAQKQVVGAPAVFFELPLPDPEHPPRETQLARTIAVIPGTRHNIHGLDVDPTGRRLAFTTPMQGFEFIRKEGESWPEAFKRPPGHFQIMAPQYHGLCYGLGEKVPMLYFSGENLKHHLWKVRIPVLKD